MILIVAYGNSLRRDDGAGFFLADALERIWIERQREVERIDTHQLMPEIAQDVAAEGVSAVVFADARVAVPREEGPGPLRIQVRRIGTDVRSPSVGHHLDPTVVMLYARLLYGKDPPAWVATVPGVDFDHGEGLSETARSALEFLPDILSELGVEWPLEPSAEDLSTGR